VEVLKQIQDQPAKVVNGANFTENRAFTEAISRMMSQQLDVALAKRDMKTLSRFARSDLVDDKNKDRFIETINQPRGLRGVLVRAVNRTNSLFQNLANRIDKYFDVKKERILKNSKIDKHLQEYQLQEFQKAPPLKQLDLEKIVDAKLMALAEDFAYVHGINELGDSTLSDKKLQNTFLEAATKLGFSIIDSKTALAQAVEDREMRINRNKMADEYLRSQVKDLEKELKVFQIKEASKNETIEDFKFLSEKLSPVDCIDILIKNKEYLNLSEDEKLKVENKYLYAKEPLEERAKEIKAVIKELRTEQKPVFETQFVRDTTINFSSKATKDEINQTWSRLQKINREQQAQNRDFMNISAVRFGGVSQKSLESWQTKAAENGIDEKITQKFVDATLRNAKELEKIGIFKEVKAGEYRFVDTFAKEALYQNLDKPVAEIEKANRGVEREVQINQDKQEFHERVQDLSSEKSFAELKNNKGEIQPDKLMEYAQKLESLSIALREQMNNKALTQDDLNLANRGQSQSQEREHGQERA